MPKRILPNAPTLMGSKIKVGRELGRGRFIEAHTATVTDKAGRRRNIVTRFPRTDVHYSFPEFELKKNQRKWLNFQKLGLPVPEFSKLDFRKKSPTYLHTIVPNLEKRYGKLIPVNSEGEWSENRGKPTFLKNLKLSTDRTLISELAGDLATLHRNRYRPFWIDFWHFYKKGNTYGRVMIDFENLSKLKKEEKATTSNMVIINTFNDIRAFMGASEFEHFVKSYIEKVKSKPLAEFMFDQYLATWPPYNFEPGNSRRRDHWKKQTLKQLGYE